MSVEFTLEENRLEREAWRDLVDSWTESMRDELYEDPTGGAEDESALHVYGEGSIRGFHVYFQPGTTSVRLDLMASVSDWKRCYSLCRAAIERGGGVLVRENGDRYTAGELTEVRAESDGREDFATGLRMARSTFTSQGATRIHLPTRIFEMGVDRDELEGSPEDVSDRLASRFKRYATAHIATLTFAHPDAGQGCAVSAWGCVFPKRDFVVMPELASLDARTRMVPWTALEARLGSHLEAVGDGVWYLPPYDALPTEVVAAIRGLGEPFDASSVQGVLGTAGGAEELDDAVVLAMAPIVVLMVVAGSDGSIDRKELSAGVRFMQAYTERGESRAVGALFLNSMEQLESLLKRVMKAGAPLVVLARIGGVIERQLEPADAAAFRTALTELATSVASASGGFLGIFGSKISKEERAAIALIEAMLDPAAAARRGRGAS